MAVEISYAVDVDGRPIPMITAPDGLSADDAKRMKRWIEDVQAA